MARKRKFDYLLNGNPKDIQRDFEKKWLKEEQKPESVEEEEKETKFMIK